MCKETFPMYVACTNICQGCIRDTGASCSGSKISFSLARHPPFAGLFRFAGPFAGPSPLPDSFLGWPDCWRCAVKRLQLELRQLGKQNFRSDRQYDNWSFGQEGKGASATSAKSSKSWDLGFVQAITAELALPPPPPRPGHIVPFGSCWNCHGADAWACPSHSSLNIAKVKRPTTKPNLFTCNVQEAAGHTRKSCRG